MMYLCYVNAQLATKSYAYDLGVMRYQASSPAVAANKALRAAQKNVALKRRKLASISVKVVPVPGSSTALSAQKENL